MQVLTLHCLPRRRAFTLARRASEAVKMQIFGGMMVWLRLFTSLARFDVARFSTFLSDGPIFRGEALPD